jgi:type I restriction enzyme, S subunit
MTELPTGWRLAELNDLQSEEPRAITDGPFGSNLARAHYTSSGPRVVRLQNIGDGVFNDARAHISEAHFQTLRTHEVLPGDLLIASLGEVLPRACIAPISLGPAIVKADCIRVRLSREVDPRWVMYSMQRPQVRRWADDHRHGVGRPRLGLKVIRQIPVPLPPLDEQHRIVDILEDHLSRLDAAGFSMSSVTRRLTALRAASLGAFWNRALEIASAVPIGTTGSVVTGSTPSTRGQDPFGGEIPFLTPSDVGHGDLISTNQRSLNETGAAGARLVGPSAVVVVCIGATIGKVGWINQVAASNQQINTVDLDDSLVLPEFLSAAVAAPQFQRQMLSESSNTTMPLLNRSKFSRLLVPVPDVASQRTILDDLNRCSNAGARAANATAACDRRKKNLRRALLMAAFSGRLTGLAADMEIVEEMAGV